MFTLKMKLKINDLKNKKIVILGAGGAAKAALYCVREMQGTEISIINRTKKRFEKLKLWAEDFLNISLKYIPWKYLNSVFSRYSPDLIINATPLGLKGEKIELDFDRAGKKANIFDMTYNRNGSYLVYKGKEYGLTSIDGIPMLIAQGVESFKIWTGIKYDPEKILNYVLRRLKNGQDFSYR